MAHQQPPPSQPYNNGGGRGRGNGAGGRGNNNGGYNNPQQYPPNMNYGGRGGIPQQIGAWPQAPATSSPGVGYPNLSNGPPGSNSQQHLQSPPVAGGIQSPPLNSSLQQQANRNPNLKPAPPQNPYSGGTPQQQGSVNAQQQQRQPQPQQATYNPYNNPYAVPNQYGYQPQQRQHHQQWQDQQQQMSYGQNNPYQGGGGGHNIRNTPNSAPVYYPMMQSQPSGAINGGVQNATGMQPPSTPNAVVPPPRPKKALTITDKDGNVVDFSSIRKAKKDSETTPSTEATPSTSTTVSISAPSATIKPKPPLTITVKASDAGLKMLQLAKARLEGKDIKSTDDIVTPTAAAAAAPEKKVDEVDAETAAPKDVATPAATALESKELDEKAIKVIVTPDAAVVVPVAETIVDESSTTNTIDTSKKSSLQEQLATSTEPSVNVVSPTPTAETVDAVVAKEFRVYTKDFLLGLKDLPECMERPEDLPGMEIVRTEARSGGGGRPGPAGGGGGSGRRNSSQRNMDNSVGSAGATGGGDQWSRGSNAPPRRQSSQTDRPPVSSPADQWSRGQAPPKQQAQPPSNAKGAGRSGRGNFANNQVYDDEVEPLVKSENHWRPQKNSSALIVAEKKVKAILNKMTKEKFDRLSEQMLEIPLLSYETLNMMINHVYEKAIDEPSFGDLYADLCTRLSEIASDNKFVHIIESDEEPPTDDGEVETSVVPDNADDNEGTSRNKVYRWSHDISTSDAEIVGPFATEVDCIDAAFDQNTHPPIPRGDMELDLVSVMIKRRIFMKIMKKQAVEEGVDNSFYVVYFPVGDAEGCGQQISDIFLSEVECISDASKKNSFKRSLLNKCQEEFQKKDIYDSWQKEKQQYEDMKSKLTDQERAMQESELNFRRIKIKKQMLGNVKFIGQLYKVNLLKVKVMRSCIGSMLKLEERNPNSKNPTYEDTGNTDIDEEDHEAICNMFATIGATIDKPASASFMQICFQKIDNMIQKKDLPTRSKFMYKDLIDLRSNNWVPRRKEEKAKTIAEIREDVEAEERRQEQLSAQLNARGNKNDPRSSGRNDYYPRTTSSLNAAANRPRAIKAVVRTDDDGFTTVAGTGRSTGPTTITLIKKEPVTVVQPNNAFAAVAPLDQSDLERKIKGMRADYLACNGNTEELLLTWEEISGTPNAGIELVRKNSEWLMEAKDVERDAIFNIIRELSEKGKLTKADVQSGLSDAIEFVDDLAADCPRFHEFLGILCGDMLRIKMFDIIWLCDQCEKTKKIDPDSVASEKLLKFSFREWKKSTNSDIVKSHIQINDARLRELIGVDKLKTIIDEL